MLQEQIYKVSTNGIGSFQEASPDYELAPVGLGSMSEQAQKLAEFGRNGDIYVVHAAEGETVIPTEVLEANPQIKNMLFQQMRGMGLEPEEYIVGNELNSINPVTGMPEFFIKKVFKRVKKTVNKVIKAVKKAAPIIIPIAASAFGMPFLGPMFGAGTIGAAALGSGIGTLVGGGSLKDAFKSALISGGISGLTSGLGSLAQGNTFSSGFSSALSGKTPVFNAAGQQVGFKFAASPFSSGPAGAASSSQFQALGQGKLGSLLPGGLGGGYQQPVFNAAGTTQVGTVNASGIFSPSGSSSLAPNVGTNVGTNVAANVAGSTNVGTNVGTNVAGTNVGTNVAGTNVAPVQSTILPSTQAGQAKMLQNAAQNALAAQNQGVLGKFMPKSITGQQVAAALPMSVPRGTFTPAQLTAAANAVNPGLIAQYGPMAGAGLGIAAATGAFTPAQPQNPTTANLAGVVPSQTGAQLLAANPSQFTIGQANLNPLQFATSVNPQVASTFPQVAEGGYMGDFPRREGHITGPGGPKDDLIPAMLSDNEFVMTAEAVEGAGGPETMYNLMRNFEMNARNKQVA